MESWIWTTLWTTARFPSLFGPGPWLDLILVWLCCGCLALRWRDMLARGRAVLHDVGAFALETTLGHCLERLVPNGDFFRASSSRKAHPRRATEEGLGTARRSEHHSDGSFDA